MRDSAPLTCRFPFLGLLLTVLIFVLVRLEVCSYFRISIQNESSFQLASLFFLNEVNYSRLHQSSYHVVSLKFAGDNESYIMHLSKPDDLFNAESLGFGPNEIEEYSCVYTATIISGMGKVGMGSLSSCHHLTGLEGLISLNHTLYQITPGTDLENVADFAPGHHVSRTYRSAKVVKIPAVNHKVVVAKPTAQSSIGDAKHIDPKELEKAYEEMLKEQENLEDESDEDDEEQENSNVKAVKNSTRIAIAVPVKITNAKRPRSQKKVVELAIFTDETFYKRYKGMQPNAGDTDNRINKFILALVNNMNYLYAQPSMKEKVSFRLVNVEVQKSTPSGLKTTADGGKYLDYFCQYAGKKDKNGKKWDHAMMITGYDLKDSGKFDLLGIAFTSTMCLRYMSCSLVEFQKGFETAFTATHEIGHTLGIEHDGEAMNKKCNPSKFIMAALAGSGQINWSPCSSKNLKTYLASGDPAPKIVAPKYIPRCLTKKSTRGYKINYQTGKMPGQAFTADEQCKLACKGCTPYTTQASPYNNICWMLHCKNTASKSIVPISPALEGTACGADKKKSCRYGRCQ